MELKIEVLENGRLINLFINKELLNILLESTRMYLSAVRATYDFEKSEENKRNIELVKEILMDLILYNAYTNDKKIKMEFNFHYFNELKNIVSMSADILDKMGSFKNIIEDYKDFGKKIEIVLR